MADQQSPPPSTERTRVRRRAQRASYEPSAIHAILDAAPMAHIAYAIDGQPFCIPTLHWRMNDRVYFHGARASRTMGQADGAAEICLTVSILDGFVLARSAFHHSVNYRSVVVFGVPRVEEGAQKSAALEAFIEQLFPGRSPHIRAPSEEELAATAVSSLPLNEASAKVRDAGVADAGADMHLPVWAGVLPVALSLGVPIPDAGCDETAPGRVRRLGRAVAPRGAVLHQGSV